MPFELSTIDQALFYRFDGSDRLYTDHEGRRVVVDVEGSGEMRLVYAEPDVLTVREDEDPKLFAEAFIDGAIVLAKSAGGVEIQVAKPFLRDLSTELAEWVTLPVRGCGWVVDAKHWFDVDERHEAAPAPSDYFPVPFRIGVSGNGSVKVVSSKKQTCQLAGALDIDDPTALKAHDFKVQNMTAIRELDSSFADGTQRVAGVASHLNAAQIFVKVPSDNQGVILRKIYDRFHGRQRARVIIDGKFAGWWYEPAEDRIRRWHVSDFGVPAELTYGKTDLQITIDPPAGTALWSVSRMEIYTMTGDAQ